MVSRLVDTVPGHDPAVVTKASTRDVRELAEAGAQVVDVLPAKNFAEEHLPGAINIPMADIASAADQLDRTKPVIAYCHDHQCDLSARAAARLAELGFTDVYDYVDSKVAWFAEGLPSAGMIDDSRRAIARVHRDLPTVSPDTLLSKLHSLIGDWEIVAVTNDANVVLGVVRREAQDLAPKATVASVMQPAPPTVRPSISIRELAESMDKNGEHFLLVTTLGGELIGLVRRSELDAA